MQAWEFLSKTDNNIAYGDVPVSEIITAVTGEPVVGLELGCNRGATGAELKRRFPNLYYIGVETCKAAAEIAASRLDEVIVEDFLSDEHSLNIPGEGTIDLVVAADVLEHLYDPWATLRKIRGLLRQDARLYATIPNVRNLWLLGELARGNWQYERVGLLDITHIRFFTLRSAIEMFESTGYEVLATIAFRDPRLPEISPPPDNLAEIQVDGLTLHGLDHDAVLELTALKFLFIAAPADSG